MQVMTGVSLYYFLYVAGSKSMFSIFTMFAGIAEISGLFLFPWIAKHLTRNQVLLASLIPTIGLGRLFVIGYLAPTNFVLTASPAMVLNSVPGFSLGL